MLPDIPLLAQTLKYMHKIVTMDKAVIAPLRLHSFLSIYIEALARYKLWLSMGWSSNHWPLGDVVVILRVSKFNLRTRWVDGQSVWKTSCLVSHIMRSLIHDDVINWKHCPRYWPFVRGIHRSPVNSPHKGQWRGVLMFSLICAWITV